MPNVTEIESDKMSIWNWGSLNLKPEMVLLHTSSDNCDASTVNYHGSFNKEKEIPEAELAIQSLGW